MTLEHYALTYAIGAAVIFICIWLEKQWCMAKGKHRDSCDIGMAIMITVCWPIILVVGVMTGIGAGCVYLWSKPVLFKKKEKKACPYKGIHSDEV